MDSIDPPVDAVTDLANQLECIDTNGYVVGHLDGWIEIFPLLKRIVFAVDVSEVSLSRDISVSQGQHDVAALTQAELIVELANTEGLKLEG